MAGSATPNGLTPVGLLGGRPFSGSTQQIPITTTYGTSIFNGDLVEVSADGTVILATVTNSGVNAGVFMGCFYTDAQTGPQYSSYWPASQAATDAVAYVLQAPDALYRIQADGQVEQADLFANFSVVLTAGSTITGRSKMALDADTPNTTNTLPLRLVGFWNGPNSEVNDSFTDCIVMLNPGQHQLADSLGT